MENLEKDDIAHDIRIGKPHNSDYMVTEIGVVGPDSSDTSF